MMTTVYSICVCPAGGDGLDLNEHRRAVQREAFSTSRNFLPTFIRQRPWFGILGRATKKSLLATVSLPVIAETSFVTCAGRGGASRRTRVRGTRRRSTPARDSPVGRRRTR